MKTSAFSRVSASPPIVKTKSHVQKEPRRPLRSLRNIFLCAFLSGLCDLCGFF